MTYLWSIFLNCLLISLPIFATAGSNQTCKSYSFLKHGLNLNDVEHCQYHLKSCPKTGPVLDQACVKQIIKNDQACRQLNKLSDVLNADIATLTFEKFEQFILVDQVFPADGQHNYYIITPRGCLTNTKIDPRQLSSALKKQYKNTIFMIVNWGKPKFQVNPNGTVSFSVLLKVTKNCLACESIGWVKVRYDFAKNGKLIKTNLLSFSKKQQV